MTDRETPAGAVEARQVLIDAFPLVNVEQLLDYAEARGYSLTRSVDVERWQRIETAARAVLDELDIIRRTSSHPATYPRLMVHIDTHAALRDALGPVRWNRRVHRRAGRYPPPIRPGRVVTPSTPTGRQDHAKAWTNVGIGSPVDHSNNPEACEGCDFITTIEREAVEAYRLVLRGDVVAMTPLQHPPIKGAAVRAWVDRAAVLRLIEGEKP